MKGNWIPWAKGLHNKIEVQQLAQRFGISHWEAACRCMIVWEWADDHTSDGHVPGVGHVTLDNVTGLAGFGAALIEVGWLVQDEGGITFPSWQNYNPRSTKARLQARDRKRRQRQRDALRDQVRDSGA